MATPVDSPHAGTVRWVEVELGDRLEAGDVVMVLDSADGEVRIEAEDAGTVVAIQVSETEPVAKGDTVALLE